MKNIVIFYPSFERGGATRVLINLLNFFSKKKKNIYLITNKKDTSLKNIKNLKIFTIKKYNLKFINSRILSGLSSLGILANLLKKLQKKDTVILSMQSNFFSVLLTFFLRWKISIRVSEDPCGATKYADNKLFAILVLITKFFTYKLSDRIIVNALKSQNCIKKFVFNKNKVKLLYNPTLLKIEKQNNFPKKNYFLNVGRICKQKNQSMLIDAFYEFYKNNKKYKLLFYGDGPDKEKLLKKVTKLNLKKSIKFLGWQTDMSYIYKRAKLFLLTSYYEGMPNVLIDAVNFETPSIAFNVSGVEDILLNGKGGEIIKNKNSKELTKRIKNSLSDYKKILIKTKRSKNKIDKYYIEKAGQKYINLLK